jgi:hypothetical protein
LVGDNQEFREAGLRAYRTVRPLSREEEELVNLLDETGCVLGAANWLKWLYHDGREFADRRAVARRLSVLVGRIAAWQQRVP